MFGDTILLALLSAQMDAILNHLRCVSFEIGRGHQGEAKWRLSEAYRAATCIGELAPKFDRQQKRVVIEDLRAGPVDFFVTDEAIFTTAADIQDTFQRITDRLSRSDEPESLQHEILLLLTALRSFLTSPLEPSMPDDGIDSLTVLDPACERYKIACGC